QFYHVAVDDAFPYRVYGAQQDAGTAAVASRSDFGELTFRDWAPVGAGESGYIAPDPLNPDIVYGGDTYGGVHRFDRVTGQSQDITPWPAPSFGQPMPQRRYRFTWTSPIVFDRKAPPDVLPPWSRFSLTEASPSDTADAYVAVDRHRLDDFAPYLYRTRDGGRHWTRIDQGIAAHSYAQVVRADPARPGLLYAGT